MTDGTPHDHAICGAKTRKGTPCQLAPMANGRCRLHGGKSLAGIASPAFRHGRYSKHLPTRLAATYEEAAADTELLALREDIALLDARLEDLLARVDTGESGRLWQAAQQAFWKFRAASDSKRPEKMREALIELEHTIGRGVSDYAAWNEITAMLEQRRKLVESERRRLVDMQQMITTERTMVLLAAVVDTVRKHVEDRNALSAIAADIRALVSVETRGRD